MTFDEANRIEHPIETEWHYPIMIEFGYVPETKSQRGFVRRYKYVHPETNQVVFCSTGANSDHWNIPEPNPAFGFWGSLKENLQRLKDGKA